MTPAGHLATSYLAGRLLPKLALPAVVIGGALPDSDFLLFLFPWFNQIHRVITHNLLFLGMAALLGGLLVKQGRRGMIAVSLLIGGILHLSIDSCLDNNPSNGIGVALFWPFSDRCYSLVNFLKPAATRAGWAEPIQMIRAALPLVLIEAPFILGAVLLYLKPPGQASPSRR